MLRLLHRLLRGVGYVLAGVAVAFVLIGVLDSTDGASGFVTPLLLLVAAIVAFGLAAAVAVAADHAELVAERERATRARRLSPAEWEAEGLREMPRLAREHGRARRAPMEDDDPLDV